MPLNQKQEPTALRLPRNNGLSGQEPSVLFPKQVDMVVHTPTRTFISKAGRYGGTYAHKDIHKHYELLKQLAESQLMHLNAVDAEKKFRAISNGKSLPE